MKLPVISILAALTVANPIPQTPGADLTKSIMAIVNNALKIAQDVMSHNSAGVRADIDNIINAALAIPKAVVPKAAALAGGAAKAGGAPRSGAPKAGGAPKSGAPKRNWTWQRFRPVHQ
jgi:hypothetical protein